MPDVARGGVVEDGGDAGRHGPAAPVGRAAEFRSAVGSSADPAAGGRGRGAGAGDHEAGRGGEPDPGRIPSIHYRHAIEHASKAFDFEPGGKVTVPFEPRTGDGWEVDGGPPMALPAGHATGQEMRKGPPFSDWAAGLPADVAQPRHFAENREARDGPIGSLPAAPAADPDDPARSVAVPSGVAPRDEDRVDVAARVGPNGLRREVFGFLPYWELDGDTVLDWRTLSTVAYFSVGCTPSGALAKRNRNGSPTTGWAGWTSSRMTSIINAAHRNHTRVVLTVSCFAWSSGGAATQASLLRSPASRARLARQVAAAVRDRGADGVNLDFEPLVAGYAEEFTSLVRAVRRELSAISRGYQLTFDTLGFVGNQPIAAATAPGGADAVFVMGYDYRTAGSPVAGSISPLAGPGYDLTDTVRAYTARISPSKVILGVPYYGRAWSTATSSLHAKTLPGAKYGWSAEPTYAQAVDLVAANGRRWDSVEKAPWTAYRKRTCTAAHGCVTAWRQLYYDDAASLRLRYDLVDRSNLRGAGIWALGYDGARPELRRALEEKFREDRLPPRVGVNTLAQHQRDEGFRVGWSASDDSGVARHDVQASTDGGPWRAWLTGTTATSAIFPGAHGRTYAFRVRATDARGNVSAWKALPLGNLDAPRGIAVGGFATVLTRGLPMRTSPSTGAATITRFAKGAAVQVVAGPRAAGGYTWYQVAGPVRQWAPVAPLHVGGWVAASGNGARNLAPRRPVYATRVDAGITGLVLAGGGTRALSPNGDGTQDTLSVSWTNRRAFDRIALKVHRANGSLAGTVVLGRGKRAAGPQSYAWNGRIGGRRVPAGTYVIALHAVARSTVYRAPSPSPAGGVDLGRWGVIVGGSSPTAVRTFASPASPNRARSLTWRITFGGPVGALSAGDFSRTGTATGCRIGTPTGSGATWSVTLTGCSAGTVTLRLGARTVTDAVRNWGPAAVASAPPVLIDRTAPTTGAPRASLRSGTTLASADPSSGVLAVLTWSARDRGGAGLRTYDVGRSRDGGPFVLVAAGLTSRSLPVSLPTGHDDRFRVRAHDRAGNVGPWQAGPTLRPARLQQGSRNLAYRGAWTDVPNPVYSGGSTTVSSTAGASVRYTFTGRGIAWVTARGPGRGAARVFIDGRHVATIDTQAVRASARVVAFSRTWSRVGTHTLRLVVVGTPGHPRVDLDAIDVLR